MANNDEKLDLDIYNLVLTKPTNLMNGRGNNIRDTEMEICKRISRESNQNFYTKLDKINKEIENYKL